MIQKEKIAITLLTWNNIENTKIFLNSLYNELNIARGIFDISVFCCDNGSTDGTIEYFDNECPVQFDKLILLKSNCGISIAKNMLIEESIKSRCKYMFMFDNDVSIVENTLTSFVNYMENNKSIGCAGQYIYNYSKDIEDKSITKSISNIEESNVEFNILNGIGTYRGCTHYSIFRCSIFNSGVRFDEGGPFGSPGYGFDDDDLSMQIVKKGYQIGFFKNIRCYHNISSSVNLLECSSGTNYQERSNYFLKKWKIGKDLE